MNFLSIIVPVYNEKYSIRDVLDRIDAVSFSIPYEVVIVDDGSTDGTGDLLKEHHPVHRHAFFHKQNRGKGSAIRTGLAHARGNFFVIQDADLEYNPQDLPRLLQRCIEQGERIVYGSRVLEHGTKRYSTLIFHWGGLLVTWWTNLLYGTSLTDEATCYKMFTREVLDGIQLTCHGFEFCPELTAKALRAGFSITEVPISYTPRGKREGKKIKIHDGFIALWTLFRIRFLGR